jgi:excisionase family DNA binding protein
VYEKKRKWLVKRQGIKMAYKSSSFNDLSGSDVFRKSRGQSVAILLFTPEEAAAALGCSLAMVRKQIWMKTIDVVRLGALVRIPFSELQRISREGFVPPLVTVGAYDVEILDVTR